ncbi:hypothetical protein BY996DRAFT_6482228 [Phakopsora pachyrhizi]|nr:hypothetical protein BY996DRAFT_6482228 [Phakopsora pachyrhizi]
MIALRLHNNISEELRRVAHLRIGKQLDDVEVNLEIGSEEGAVEDIRLKIDDYEEEFHTTDRPVWL